MMLYYSQVVWVVLRLGTKLFLRGRKERVSSFAAGRVFALNEK